MRPVVFALTAASSPSIRPLTAITPGGREGSGSRDSRSVGPARHDAASSSALALPSTSREAANGRPVLARACPGPYGLSSYAPDARQGPAADAKATAAVEV